MNAYAIVLAEHLNHQGVLFGGQMLRWVDEYAWLAAARDFPTYRLVTRAMDAVEFKIPVPLGAILRFHTMPKRRGKTSICYEVTVHADMQDGQEEFEVFRVDITFVSIDVGGQKRELPWKATLRSELPDMVGHPMSDKNSF